MLSPKAPLLSDAKRFTSANRASVFREVPRIPAGANRLGESLAFQRREVLVNAHGWLLQALTLPLGRCADDVRSKVELVREEVVGMLCLDAIRLEDSLGKVLRLKVTIRSAPQRMAAART